MSGRLEREGVLASAHGPRRPAVLLLEGPLRRRYEELWRTRLRHPCQHRLRRESPSRSPTCACRRDRIAHHDSLLGQTWGDELEGVLGVASAIDPASAVAGDARRNNGAVRSATRQRGAARALRQVSPHSSPRRAFEDLPAWLREIGRGRRRWWWRKSALPLLPRGSAEGLRARPPSATTCAWSSWTTLP